MTSITILGGGPAGLGLAFYAHRAGVPFVLLEASSDLGGMCRTFRCGEHLYDCGAHRFHDRDPEITRDVFELLGDSLRRVDAPSAVRDRGRFIDFPPTPLNALFAYGLRGAGRIGLDLVRSLRRRRGPAASFEDLAIATFGETLARRILLNYSAKLWGLPPDQLSPDVATRRLRGMTLRSLIHEVVSPRQRVSHVDGSFLYPRRGYGEIVDALTRALPPESIRLRCEVVALQSRGGVVTQVVCSGGRTVEKPDRIVSTLPLPLLVRLLADALPDEARAAAGRLRLRHVRLIFLRLGTRSLSDYASIYVPDPAFCVSRIYEPRNRSAEMAPEGETSIVAEVPCFPGDDAERLADEDLANKVVEELAALGLLNPADVVEWRAPPDPQRLSGLFDRLCAGRWRDRIRAGGDPEPGHDGPGGPVRLQPSPRPAPVREGLRPDAHRFGSAEPSEPAPTGAVRGVGCPEAPAIGHASAAGEPPDCRGAAHAKRPGR